MRLFLIAGVAFLLVLVLPHGRLDAQVAERGWNDSYRENIDEEYFGAGRRDALTGRYQVPHRSGRRAPWSPGNRRHRYFVWCGGMWAHPVWIWVQVS